MLCGDSTESIAAYDGIGSVDALIVESSFMAFETVLDILRLGGQLAKSSARIFVHGCDPDPSAFHVPASASGLFFATQAWRHAQSFGFVDPILSAESSGALCMGRFPSRVNPVDTSVQLSFLAPQHNEVVSIASQGYAKRLLTASVDIDIQDGAGANAVKENVAAWNLCFRFKSGGPDLLPDRMPPQCFSLTEKLRPLQVPEPLPSSATATTWLLSAWVGVTPEWAHRVPVEHHILGFETISVHEAGDHSVISRSQAAHMRFRNEHNLEAQGQSYDAGVKNVPFSPLPAPEKWAVSTPDGSPLRRWAFMATCSRGTGYSTLTYARYLEKYMGGYLSGPSLLLCIPPRDLDFEVLARQRFDASNMIQLSNWPQPEILDPILAAHNITDVYMQKQGQKDGVVSLLPRVRTCVHCVFFAHEPHGTIYARISNTVKGRQNEQPPTVPYPVEIEVVTGDLRAELDISPTATVFGRYGGDATFDIDFVHQEVSWLSQHRDDIVFIFMNTKPFCDESPTVKFLTSTSNSVRRAQFVRTCDAMLHARYLGETFGLAIAEFSIQNRPIITFGGSVDSAHLAILGAKGLVYFDSASLRTILLSFNRTMAAQHDWNAFREFEPEQVMRRFVDVFW